MLLKRSLTLLLHYECVGIIRFTQLVKLLEKQDAEVQRLNSELRSIVLPPMSPIEDAATRVPAPV